MCQLIGKYGIGLKSPSYHELKDKYLRKEVDNTMSLLEKHKAMWRKSGCSIMSDGWTNKKRRSICNFLVNSPNGTIFFTSIDTSDISKTADKVFEMIDDIVEQVGEENVIQIVTDNAANYKAAGEMLMEKRKKLFWTPCAAHCIDLMLEDLEKKIKVMDRMLDDEERDKVDLQLEVFKHERGLFGFSSAKSMRFKKTPADWWESYGADTPKLQRFSIRILSLTCSSSGCRILRFTIQITIHDSTTLDRF
ncbi:hypothetical protein CRG98_040429 [Punica granatum]|uniref:DUF659 domain-containing protein n=1 Tax=Punica granatum TaxID=22663 RepID=A0A2I0I5V0_PUNGR|nr:hypothetical protein CRG98_040429 [Punica granatum]